MNTPMSDRGSLPIAEFRAQFPILRDRAYLFSGALSPAAIAVRTEWDRWTEGWSMDPNSLYTTDAMFGEMNQLRHAFATLIGASESEIAITDNTSRAANIAVRILESRPKGNVVVDESTYPSSNYPWRAHQLMEVRHATPADDGDAVSAFAAQVDKNTVAICVSHVAPFSGRRHDLRRLAQLAHTHGAVLMVDAAQSTGVWPIDVQSDGIDVLVTTSMKWLLGPPGIGYLYIANHVLRDAPIVDVGYVGLDVDADAWRSDILPPVSPKAIRYELGLPSLPALAAARAGINLLLSVGVEQISAHVEGLVTHCIAGLTKRGGTVLTPIDPVLRAGVIVCHIDRVTELYDLCRGERVDIGVIPQGARIDPHGFNNEDDIDRFLSCFDRL